MERVLIAAFLKAAGKLMRNHPVIAAELLVSGASEGGKVGLAELRKLLQRRRERRISESRSLAPDPDRRGLDSPSVSTPRVPLRRN
jgi:hypothetical protein